MSVGKQGEIAVWSSRFKPVVLSLAFLTLTMSLSGCGNTVGTSTSSTNVPSTAPPVSPTVVPTEVPPAAQGTLEVVDRGDGYRAKVSVAVSHEQEWSGLDAPRECIEVRGTMNSGDGSKWIYRVRTIYIQAESVSVNGFDWPGSLGIPIDFQGAKVCRIDGSLHDYYGKYYEIYPGQSAMVVVASWAEKTPNHPGGDWSDQDWGDLTLMVASILGLWQGVPADSCRAAGDATGFIVEEQYLDNTIEGLAPCWLRIP